MGLKYGPEWHKYNCENRSKHVTPKIVKLLSVDPPGKHLVIKKLEEIAEEFDVEWEYQPEDEDIPCEEEDQVDMEDVDEVFFFFFFFRPFWLLPIPPQKK